MSMTTPRVTVPVDELAQEIRRVDGNHDLGAGALAEALLPFLSSRLSASPAPEGGAVRRVHIARASGTIDQQLVAVRQSETYKRGDTVLCWVNEGDLYANPSVVFEDLTALATPAEAGADGDLTPERVLSRICDAQKRHYGNATALHLAMIDLCIDGRAALALRAQPPARSGKVTWHSSGEDEGPDVGLQLDLGHGRSLWLGEGQKPTGWQFSLVQGDDIIPVADVIDHEQARDLFDLIASAVQPPAREDAQPVHCHHEAYQGYCAHCGVKIVNGFAVTPKTHPAPDALRVAPRNCEGCDVPPLHMHEEDCPVMAEALAALQAEQGAK